MSKRIDKAMLRITKSGIYDRTDRYLLKHIINNNRLIQVDSVGDVSFCRMANGQTGALLMAQQRSKVVNASQSLCTI